MNNIQSAGSRICVATLAMFAAVLVITSAAMAQTESVLHTFTGGMDGSQGGGFFDATGSDAGNLVFDDAGNLYGTAFQGGITNTFCDNGTCGVVYELSPDGSGGWSEKTLHAFTGGEDGFWPRSGVVIDASGNIYGTTEWGGPYPANCLGHGCGVVYELSPNGHGGYKTTVLHAFTGGADGANPYGNLILDSAGNLYGTTLLGGSLTACSEGCGVAFELSRDANGSWSEELLHTFRWTDGDQPYGGLVLDSTGNLYGSTTMGGTAGRGVIFEVSPKAGGGWQETTVHNFEGFVDGTLPAGNLLLDTEGNIFGATFEGGLPACAGDLGCGLIFELQRQSGGWNISNLYIVPHDSPPSPTGSLSMDSAGNLYEALAGYSNAVPGSVIKLTKSSGYSETTIFEFSASATAGGEYPDGGVTLDRVGNLYGTTSSGGSTSCGCGVIYEITP